MHVLTGRIFFLNIFGKLENNGMPRLTCRYYVKKSFETILLKSVGRQFVL